jgi:hypothetical protein
MSLVKRPHIQPGRDGAEEAEHLVLTRPLSKVPKRHPNGTQTSARLAPIRKLIGFRRPRDTGLSIGSAIACQPFRMGEPQMRGAVWCGGSTRTRGFVRDAAPQALAKPNRSDRCNDVCRIQITPRSLYTSYYLLGFFRRGFSLTSASAPSGMGIPYQVLGS